MGDGNRRILHLIYIHGFNGDHTSFQAFPTDLHAALVPRLAISHPDLELKSSLYPTYKSRKPLTQATQNFLQWMVKQPPADVILSGHSMGGLLAAEAATSISKHGKDHRVIGLLAFDVPFLGMHPHVVITGIASLFPQDDDKLDAKSEAELNDSTVQLVSEHDVHQSQPEENRGMLSTTDLHPTHSQDDDEWDQFKNSPARTKTPESWEPKPNFFNKSLQFFAKHSQDPVVKFFKKHKDNPLGAAKIWIVEHFSFGIIMFEPQELLARYKVLEHWNKPWINYWTVTVEKPVESGSHSPTPSEATTPDSPLPWENYTSVGELYQDLHRDQPGSSPGSALTASKSHPLLPPGAAASDNHSGAGPQRHSSPTPSTGSHHPHSPSPSPSTNNGRPKLTKPRHFITTPSSRSPSSRNWEKVDIRGVKDEVGAHCGIFITSQNLEYEAFVERVARRVESWIT